jgi:hypothetical protein
MAPGTRSQRSAPPAAKTNEIILVESDSDSDKSPGRRAGAKRQKTMEMREFPFVLPAYLGWVASGDIDDEYQPLQL